MKQPAYQQIFDHFAGLITSGQLKPGDKLPTTVAIAQSFAVARMTATHAMNDLARAGFTESRGRAGTWVALQGTRRFAMAVSAAAGEVVGTAVAQVEGEVALALGVPDGSSVVVVTLASHDLRA